MVQPSRAVDLAFIGYGGLLNLGAVLVDKQNFLAIGLLLNATGYVFMGWGLRRIRQANRANRRKT